jgi:hypothetical protein
MSTPIWVLVSLTETGLSLVAMRGRMGSGVRAVKIAHRTLSTKRISPQAPDGGIGLTVP